MIATAISLLGGIEVAASLTLKKEQDTPAFADSLEQAGGVGWKRTVSASSVSSVSSGSEAAKSAGSSRRQTVRADRSALSQATKDDGTASASSASKTNGKLAGTATDRKTVLQEGSVEQPVVGINDELVAEGDDAAAPSVGVRGDLQQGSKDAGEIILADATAKPVGTAGQSAVQVSVQGAAKLVEIPVSAGNLVEGESADGSRIPVSNKELTGSIDPLASATDRVQGAVSSIQEDLSEVSETGNAQVHAQVHEQTVSKAADQALSQFAESALPLVNQPAGTVQATLLAAGLSASVQTAVASEQSASVAQPGVEVVHAAAGHPLPQHAGVAGESSVNVPSFSSIAANVPNAAHGNAAAIVPANVLHAAHVDAAATVPKEASTSAAPHLEEHGSGEDTNVMQAESVPFSTQSAPSVLAPSAQGITQIAASLVSTVAFPSTSVVASPSASVVASSSASIVASNKSSASVQQDKTGHATKHAAQSRPTASPTDLGSPVNALVEDTSTKSGATAVVADAASVPNVQISGSPLAPATTNAEVLNLAMQAQGGSNAIAAEVALPPANLSGFVAGVSAEAGPANPNRAVGGSSSATISDLDGKRTGRGHLKQAADGANPSVQIPQGAAPDLSAPLVAAPVLSGSVATLNTTSQAASHAVSAPQSMGGRAARETDQIASVISIQQGNSVKSTQEAVAAGVAMSPRPIAEPVAETRISSAPAPAPAPAPSSEAVVLPSQHSTGGVSTEAAAPSEPGKPGVVQAKKENTDTISGVSQVAVSEPASAVVGQGAKEAAIVVPAAVAVPALTPVGLQGRSVGANGAVGKRDRKDPVTESKPIDTAKAQTDGSRGVTTSSIVDPSPSTAGPASGTHRTLAGEATAPLANQAVSAGAGAESHLAAATGVTSVVPTPELAKVAVPATAVDGNGIHGSSGTLSETPAIAEATAPTLPHTTLQATPTVLEVGVGGGTQGWLKIRAEIGEGGTVQASMSAQTHAGQETLRRELPAMNAFLDGEHLPVSVQMVHGPSGGASAETPTGFKEGSLNLGSGLSQNTDTPAGQSRGDGAAGSLAGGETGGQSGRQQQTSEQSGWTPERSTSTAGNGKDLGDSEWTTPSGYGGGPLLNGGSWLNVLA